MIRINLLPDEYRAKARTPVKMMLAMSGAVTVNALLLAWYGWLAFGVAAEIESERSVLQTEMDGLTPQVNYHKSLEAEQKAFARREATLSEIMGRRISWTRKIDELVNVIDAGGGERHFVWLDDLSVAQVADSRSKSFGSLRGSGHSGSHKFDQVANFLEDIENSDFVHDFHPPAPPREPRRSWTRTSSRPSFGPSPCSSTSRAPRSARRP